MKFKIVESFNLKDLDFEKVFINAGKAYEKKISESDVDPKELEMGIAVEMEHTTNKDIAKRIALDHLSEGISDYYTRLAKMEKGGEKEGKKEGAEVKGGEDADKDSKEDKEDEDKSGDDASEKDDDEDEKSKESGASMKV